MINSGRQTEKSMIEDFLFDGSDKNKSENRSALATTHWHGYEINLASTYPPFSFAPVCFNS